MRFFPSPAVKRWAMILSGSAAVAFPAAMAEHCQTTKLTADQAGVAANPPGGHLVNPWGLSRSSGSPWWVSDNGMGLSTRNDGTGAVKSLVVTIGPDDPTVNPLGSPTGTVNNSTTAEFVLSNGSPAAFLFVTEDGTISGWNGGPWDLSFGSGGTSGPATTLYLTAGSDNESHGLLGTITPVENTLGNGH
jgi:hypothetical protein